LALELTDLTPELRAVVEQFIASERADKFRVESENRILREQLRLLMRQKYGPKSDKLSDLQLELLEAEPCVTPEEVAAEADRVANDPAAKTPRVPRKDREHPGRVELPAHLERRIEVIPALAGECHCGRCGKDRPLIGYEESVYLDLEPLKFFAHVVRREKRGGCACHDGVVCAPLPVRILPKSKLGDELIIEIIDQKLGMHVPVFRLCESIFRNAGVDLSRQTMCSVLGKSGDLLQPVTKVLRADLLAEGYVQADETRFGVQTREKPGRNHTAQIWQYSRPGGPVVFDFQMSRGRAGPEEFLEGFRGHLQCDGYVVYKDLGPGITYCGCLAHVRRKFVEAARLAPQDPAPREIVELMGAIYAVEAEARDANAKHAQRLELRQARSRPLMDELHRLIVAARTVVLPKSVLGRACAYALGQWTRLEVFLGNGQIEPDNNWAENAIRPVVLGRKNFLHIGSEWAGPRLAALWTVYGTCQRLGINPKDYLRSVLPRLGDWPVSRVGELSPLVWKG
jgi:transposase